MRQTFEAARSIPRAIAVLRGIGKTQQGIRASELQKQLRIPRASFYRVLHVLMREEFVLQDAETGLYRLGAGALNLGFHAHNMSTLTWTARPVLRGVARASGQLCELVVSLGGWRLMALDVWHGGETPMIVSIRAGSICRLTHRYMPGMAFLAFGSERRLRQYEELAATATGRKSLGLEHAPDAHFREEIERVRKQRYAWDRQSGSPGVGRVSVPVYDLGSEPSRVIAVLGIACTGRLLTVEQAARWGLLLRQNAGRLERVLRDGNSQEAYQRWAETSVFGDRL